MSVYVVCLGEVFLLACCCVGLGIAPCVFGGVGVFVFGVDVAGSVGLVFCFCLFGVDRVFVIVVGDGVLSCSLLFPVFCGFCVGAVVSVFVFCVFSFSAKVTGGGVIAAVCTIGAVFVFVVVVSAIGVIVWISVVSVSRNSSSDEESALEDRFASESDSESGMTSLSGLSVFLGVWYLS